jgi:phospholipid/cholesterol/gamma-HCH transport system substrate-binding protein
MKGTAIKFIAFIGVCLVFTVYLGFTIANIRFSHLWFFHRDFALRANFDDVTGLNTNDDVKVAGVIVGKVTGIKVVDGQAGRSPDGKGRALVTFVVHKSVRLPSNTEGSIRWRNLLGQRYVYLSPPVKAHASPTVLRSGETLFNTVSVVDIGQLFNRLGPIVRAIDPGKVNQFLDVVTGALSGNQDNLKSALDNLATLTASLASHDGTISHLIDNLNTVSATVNDRDAQIKAVLDNLLAISTTFSGNTQIVNDAITNLNTVNTNVDRLLKNNRDQIQHILGNLNALLNLVVAKLPQVDDALARLPVAAQKVFSVGSWGDWLNQIIPCGAIEAVGTPQIDITVPCTLFNNRSNSANPPAASGGAANPVPLPFSATGIGPLLRTLAGR